MAIEALYQEQNELLDEAHALGLTEAVIHCSWSELAEAVEAARKKKRRKVEK